MAYADQIDFVRPPCQGDNVFPIILDTTSRPYDLQSPGIIEGVDYVEASMKDERLCIRIEADGADVYYAFAGPTTLAFASVPVILQTTRVAAGGTGGSGILTVINAYCDKIPSGTWKDETIIRGLQRWLILKGSAAGTARVRISSPRMK